MMNVLLRCLVPSIVLLTAWQEQSWCNDAIAILIPAFTDHDLGMNVGTVLNLKVWRTLRVPPHPSDPDAVVSWNTSTLPDSSYESAEETAKQVHYQLVLWGSIVPVADGVVAQPLLSILMDDIVSKYAPTWTFSLPDRNGLMLRLVVTIPRLRYELPPITLSGDLLKRYSESSVLKLYKGKNDEPPSPDNLGTPMGEVGDDYKALRDEGDFVLTQPKDETGANKGEAGWLYLPDLSGDNEVVDFVGGLIRLLRRDYRRSINLLQRISRSGSSDTLKIDSLLLQALAKTKLGDDASPLIDSALKINPYLQTTIKYKIINLLSQIESASGAARKTAVSNLAQQIAESNYLFSPRDDWLDTARKILSEEQRK
jgi:hypothetical protein